jgi:hypothetical protein
MLSGLPYDLNTVTKVGWSAPYRIGAASSEHEQIFGAARSRDVFPRILSGIGKFTNAEIKSAN